MGGWGVGGSGDHMNIALYVKETMYNYLSPVNSRYNAHTQNK